MRLSGEANAQQQIRYLYNEQDYEPIARVISDRYPKTSDVHYQIEYFHTLANSLPTELTNEEGDIIWLGEYTLFGQLKHQRNRDRWYSSDKTEQNLRFAGQYYDQETGLHYNTLRYYDPNCGRFTQQDPIGLAGGINLYQYAPNTLSWIDPWGLSCRTEYMGRTPGKFNSSTGQKVIDRLRKDGLVVGKGKKALFKSPTDGKWYPIKEADMAHITDAVVWWNQTGRKYGPKSKEVRKFMLDDKNYELEHYSHNRSQGAKLRITYLPPEVSTNDKTRKL